MIEQQTQPTALDNIKRWLHWKKLLYSIVITDVQQDYVQGWPITHDLLVRMVLDGWSTDPGWIAMRFHGTNISFREIGVKPSVQVCLFKMDANNSKYAPRSLKIKLDPLYWVYIDMDSAAPNTPVGAIEHAGVVLDHWLSGNKTDPVEISRLLDERKVPKLV